MHADEQGLVDLGQGVLTRDEQPSPDRRLDALQSVLQPVTAVHHDILAAGGAVGERREVRTA